MAETSHNSVSLTRKEELLTLARKSRGKWVVEALSREDYPEVKQNTSIDRKKQADRKPRLPVEECIQSILNFLSDTIDDGSYVDVSMLIDDLPTNTSNANANANANASYLNMEDENLYQPQPSSSAISESLGQINSYYDFIDRLRRPTCFEIVRTIQQFIAKFESKCREARNDIFHRYKEEEYLDWADSIWKFIDHVYQQVQAHPIWSATTTATNEKMMSQTREYIERFVFTKLHSSIFNTDIEDIYQNQRLKERIQSLSFLTPEHLDIRSLATLHGDNQHVRVNLKTMFGDAIEQLHHLHQARCPYDMLQCIRSSSIEIANVLRQSHENDPDAKSSRVSQPGADEFLPILILLLTFTDLPYIHSIIKYLQRYIHASRLMSESGYLLTHFVSAVHFLENVDAKALTIDPEEFERSMERCKLEARITSDAALRRFHVKIKEVEGQDHSKEAIDGHCEEQDDAEFIRMLEQKLR
jgi:hypothetical protein